MTFYFRREAAQCYRAARASARPHLDYEALMLRGHYFKEKAITAVKRLGPRREATSRRAEGQEQASVCGKPGKPPRVVSSAAAS